MAKKDFTTPLTLNGDYPNLDDRYTNNGDPYTSVAAATTAMASKMNEYHIGLTVLVFDVQQGWTEAKEYWVQPYDDNGNTLYHFVEKQQGGSVPSGGIGKSSLSAEVQASLDKADTALQSVKSINGIPLAGTGNITIGEGGAVVTGGTKQVAFSDFVQGGFTTTVNDTAGNMRSMYPLNADEVEGASCATAQLTVGVFDGSWTRLSSDTVAQGEQWSNPHAAGARYVMLTVGGSTVPTVTLTVGSHVDLVKLSDVEFCGSNLFALFSAKNIAPDPNYLNGSSSIWGTTTHSVATVEWVGGASADTFGKALHIQKSGNIGFVGKTWTTANYPTLVDGHNYMIAWRGKLVSLDRQNSANNQNRFEISGIDILYNAKSGRNTLTQVTEDYVSVVDSAYVAEGSLSWCNNKPSITLGVTYGGGSSGGNGQNVGAINGYIGRYDIIDLYDLSRVPTVRELQWAYQIFIMTLQGKPSKEIRALVQDIRLTDIYVSEGQARRVYLKEGRRVLGEMGVTEYNYSNPAGTSNSISTNNPSDHNGDYDKIGCEGMAKAAVHIAGHPELLRRLAQRSMTLHAMRGKGVVEIPVTANYMGGSERTKYWIENRQYQVSYNADANTKTLNEAYEIIMCKGGNWGDAQTDSAGVSGVTATAVCLARSKKYPGKAMVGVVHFSTDVGGSVYSDLINVFDQLEEKSGAAEPSATHAGAGYVPDMPESCKYSELLTYTKGDASALFNTASMIKLFSAMVIDCWLKPGDVIEYTPDCKIGGSAINGSSDPALGRLKEVGDKYTYEEIMPAAMMGSDNEMFYAMATAAGKKMVLSRMDSTMID